MMETGVFNRTEENSSGEQLGAGVYNLAIGLVLTWGFAVNMVMVKAVPYESIAGINPIMFIIGYFASCFFGIYLFSKSDSPAVSFIGYNFVVVPFGLIINLAVARYEPDLVFGAIRVTSIVTVSMMLLATALPALFLALGRVLFVSLLLVIVVELVEVFVFGIHHGILDWIVVVIFCGYIGYDWARANQIPRTLDNAIDSAAALYIDIVNLFLRILRIMGRRR